MDFTNYTDELIEKYFQTNKMDDEDFLPNLEEKIKNSKKIISQEYEKLLKENEESSKDLDETKNQYFDKLQMITNNYSNFEYRVNFLNSHYSQKLAYISVLSTNLGEFEKFKSNINFANKIFDLINLLNSSKEIDKIMPDIFTKPEKMLEDGVEVFDALRQLVDVTEKDFPIFTENFKIVETRMKEAIQTSIKDFYENNEYNKLEKLMSVTELQNSEAIIEMYVNYVINRYDFVYIIKSLKDIQYNKISKELQTNIFTMMDEFNEKVIKLCNEEYGHGASKIFLIFPESQHKIVISQLIFQITQLIKSLREVIIKEEGKSDEVYVNLIEYIHQESLKFVEKFKGTFSYCKSDLWNSMQDNTFHFLKEVEGKFRAKDRSMLKSFLLSHYDSKVKSIEAMKRSYEMSSKNYTLDSFEQDLLDIIQSTNFSILNKFAVESINRHRNLIKENEQMDIIGSFCKDILDSISALLQTYCYTISFILEKRVYNSNTLTKNHYNFLSKISFFFSEFQHIFLYDLKDFFKVFKFFEEIEHGIRKIIPKIEVAIDKFYSTLASFTSSSLNILFKSVKPKEIYNLTKNIDDNSLSVEMEIIRHFLQPLLTEIKEFWPEIYNRKISGLITQITCEKLIDVLKNAKITEIGVTVLCNDYKVMISFFSQYMEPQFFNKLIEVKELADIFSQKKEDLDAFIDDVINLGENKRQMYDNELLKIIVKKRKALKK
jgi:hypothetical protein